MRTSDPQWVSQRVQQYKLSDLWNGTDQAVEEAELKYRKADIGDQGQPAPGDEGRQGQRHLQRVSAQDHGGSFPLLRDKVWKVWDFQY